MMGISELSSVNSIDAATSRSASKHQMRAQRSGSHLERRSDEMSER